VSVIVLVHSRKERLKRRQNTSGSRNAQSDRGLAILTLFELKVDGNGGTNKNMTSSVRMASPPDTEEITALINSAFRTAEEFFIETDRISLDSVNDLFMSGKFILGEIEGVVAACVYVELRGDRAYLGLLAVDPARQRSGLGSLLMGAAEEYVQGMGCRWMDINVVNLRHELFAFYRGRAYVEIGTSPFPANIATKLPCHFIKMTKPLAT
jgi:GNAT superfamily N-acetyltransferase